MSESAPEPTDIGGQLTRKLGPLPVWGWGLALAGGVGVAAYVRNRSLNSDASTAIDNGTPLDEVGDDGTGGAAVSDPNVFGDDLADTRNNEGPGLPTAPDITTNNQWRQLAVRAMMGAGATGLEAETAVGKYLAGLRLTAKEQGLINTAFAQLGDPPNPPPLTPGPRKPKKKPPKKKPGGKHHGKHHGKNVHHKGHGKPADTDPEHAGTNMPHPSHGHQSGLPKTHAEHGHRHHSGVHRRDQGRM